MPHSIEDLNLLLKTYSFEEAASFIEQENQKKEAAHSGRSVYEYANCYFRLRPMKKKKPKKVAEGAEQEHEEQEIQEVSDQLEFSTRISSFVIRGEVKVYVDRIGYIRSKILASDGKSEKDIFIPPDAWRTRQKMMQVLSDTKYEFKGTDNDLQDIMYLATKTIGDAQTKKGVEFIGFKDGFFAGPGFTIGKDGIVENPPIEYITQELPVEKAIKIVPCDDIKPVVKEFADTILKVNKPPVILPTLGWMVACFFKDKIQDTIEYFPILAVFGTSGAGKTSLILSLLRMFGITNRKGLFNAHATQFTATRMLASSNCIPVAVDEMKEDAGHKVLDEWKGRIRSAFFGEIVTRGRQDMSVRSFPLVAPLLIMGEMSVVKEQAIIERTISIEPKRSDLDEGAKQSFYEFQKNVKLECLFPYIIQWRLGEGADTFHDLWSKAMATLQALKIPYLPPRVYDNLVTITFGIEALRAFAKSHGVDFSIPEKDLKEAVDALTGRVLQVAQRTKMGFDSLIECLAILAKNGVIKADQDYATRGEWLYFHLATCVAAFRKWARETNYGSEVLDHREYLNQAKEIERMGNGRYVHDCQKVWRLGERTMRCVQISLRRAEASGLDVGSFGYSSEPLPQSWETPPADESTADIEQGTPEPQLPPELTEQTPLPFPQKEENDEDMFGDSSK
jgi:hypothetical protein